MHCSGLERNEEAAGLLRDAHSTLLTEFGSDFEPVGEADFYLSLATLPSSLTTEALARIEPRLLQVIHWTLPHSTFHQ